MLWEVKSNLHFPGHLYLLIEVHYLMVGGKEIEIVPMVPFLTEPTRQLKHCETKSHDGCISYLEEHRFHPALCP